MLHNVAATCNNPIHFDKLLTNILIFLHKVYNKKIYTFKLHVHLH